MQYFYRRESKIVCSTSSLNFSVGKGKKYTMKNMHTMRSWNMLATPDFSWRVLIKFSVLMENGQIYLCALVMYWKQQYLKVNQYFYLYPYTHVNNILKMNIFLWIFRGGVYLVRYTWPWSRQCQAFCPPLSAWRLGRVQLQSSIYNDWTQIYHVY